MRAVYDDLPDALKQKIAPLIAEHYLWHSREQGGFSGVTDEMRKAMPPVAHPLVRELPSGRKAVYAGAHAARVIDWPLEEGRALLDELREFANRPQFIYSHPWRQGDLVI